MAKEKDREGRALSKPGKRRSAALSEEDRALWEHAARDLKPLKSAKGRVPSGEARSAEPVPSRAREDQRPKPERIPPRKPEPQSKPERRASAPPPLATLDRRTARRIEVEARIDLHGMRQSEAHAALRRFLMQSHASGRRWVLVITGKGTAQRRDADDEHGGYRSEERGVLKRNVPRWLSEPELRSIVVGFSSAAIRHGGEGALYVQLRRRDRSRGAG